MSDPPRPWEPRVRWLAIVTYRTESGPLAIEHHLRELEELQYLVERGPHWDTIIKIEITRSHLTDGPLTVEEAEQI